MILTPEQNDIRWQINIVAVRCIHAIEYFNGITGFGKAPIDYWRFSQNCFGEVACLNWCHLFNSENKDPVHYRRLFGDNQLANLDSKFSLERIRSRLCTAAGVDEAGYLEFRENVIRFRNEFAAHREFSNDVIKFPQLDIARDMCLEMRSVLRDTVEAELRGVPDIPELIDLRNHFSEQSNDWLLKKCRREIAALLKPRSGAAVK